MRAPIICLPLWEALALFFLPISGFGQALSNYQIVSGTAKGFTPQTYWTFDETSGSSDTACFAVNITSGTNTQFIPRIEIYDPSGTAYGGASFDTRGTHLCYRGWNFTGTYKVGVFNSLGDPTHYPDAAGSFNLQFVRPGQPFDSAQLGGGLLSPGIPSSGSLDQEFFQLWSLPANAGDLIKVTAGNVSGDLPGFVNLNFQGYDPGGGEISTSNGDPPVYSFKAITTGTYTILAFQSSSGNSLAVPMTYTITATGSTAVPPSPATGPQISGKLLGGCNCSGKVQVGYPIDLASGNMMEEITDYQTTGQNELGFSRYYNSSISTGPATFAAALGANWRGTYDRYIRIVSGTSLLAERADGQVLAFTLTGGAWIPDSDIDLQLVQTGTGPAATWTLTDRNDTVETYAAVSASEATLTKIQTRNGYTQTLRYGSGNQLAAVLDSFGRTLSFTYQNNLLQTLTTQDGLILTYGYTATGPASLLTSVAYSTTPRTTQSYLYESPSFPIALTGIVDENGNRFATWTYDSSGRATASQHAGGADLTQVAYNGDGSRTVTDPLGVQTVYTFTALQGVPKVTQMSRAATATTPAASRAFTYDANGYSASQTDWNGNLTAYVNDGHGQPTSITEAAGTPQQRVTAITYAANLHLATKTVEAGLTTDFVYDGSGNLLTRTLTDTTATTVPYSTNGTKRVWTYSWANGLLTSVKGPRTDAAELTGFAYDGSGALIKTTNARGQSIQVTQHTGGGLPQKITDANGVTTTLVYDARLRLTGSTVGTAAGPRATTYAYDPAGNLLKVTLPDGAALTDAYDMAHRLTSVTDLFGQTTAYTLDAGGDRTQTALKNAGGVVTRSRSDSFDALGRLAQDTGGAGQATRYAYDGNGNAVTITDPLNRVTRQAFDPLNRLATVTDPAGGITSTVFDAHDRPVSVTAANGATTTYVYDGFGDLLQTASPDSGKTMYRYDLAGNLTQKIDAAGATVNYAYDALDRISAASYPADGAENVQYLYDEPGHGFGIGRLTSLTDAAGTLRRSYDERGNLLTETRLQGRSFTQRGNVMSAVRGPRPAALVTSYGYDAASRIVSITYPSGATTAYTRDAMGRITGVTLQPGNASPLPVASNIGYQPFGPVSGLTFGNGLTGTRSFDLDYRLTNLTDGGIQNLTYGYNAANDVLTIADAVHSGSSQNFGYDALDHLTSATGSYGSQAYTYDAVGNRLTRQAGGTAATYIYTPQSNRLAQLTTGSGTQNISYTPAGNIAEFATGPGPAADIAYNEAGRLSTVVSGGQRTLQYAYDAFGQRVVKTGTATGTTLFQYDQSGHLLEENDGHSAKLDYIYLGDLPIATFTPATGKLAFLHTDRLGTPQVATDASATVVWNANYDPFGNINAGSSQTAGVTQDLRFPGQETEVETGWNHNGFRDYVPSLGSGE